MCPNSPAEPCAPGHRQAVGQQDPADAVATCRCRATGTPRSTPRRASASPASVASLPARTGPHASDGPSAAVSVTVLATRSASAGPSCCPGPATGPRTPTPITRSPNLAAAGSPAGPRHRSAPRCPSRRPAPGGRAPYRPGQLEGGHGKGVVPPGRRRARRGPGRAPTATPVGRPLARCTVASTGPVSSSISRRPARSRTSTVAVPRARLSCLVSSARVSWPPP